MSKNVKKGRESERQTEREKKREKKKLKPEEYAVAIYLIWQGKRFSKQNEKGKKNHKRKMNFFDNMEINFYSYRHHKIKTKQYFWYN